MAYTRTKRRTTRRASSYKKNRAGGSYRRSRRRRTTSTRNTRRGVQTIRIVVEPSGQLAGTATPVTAEDLLKGKAVIPSSVLRPGRKARY